MIHVLCLCIQRRVPLNNPDPKEAAIHAYARLQPSPALKWLLPTSIVLHRYCTLQCSTIVVSPTAGDLLPGRIASTAIVLTTASTPCSTRNAVAFSVAVAVNVAVALLFYCPNSDLRFRPLSSARPHQESVSASCLVVSCHSPRLRYQDANGVLRSGLSIDSISCLLVHL